MSPDPWQSWIGELEEASAAEDDPRLRSVLEDLWRLPFHAERARRPEQWDRLFALLLGALAKPDPRIRDLAYHYLRIAMGSQRTLPIVPAAAAVISEPMVAPIYTPAVQLKA